MQGRESVVIGQPRPGPRAIARVVQDDEGLCFGHPLTMSKKIVHVRIGQPAISVPGFHGFAALGGHPSPYQEAANLIKMQPDSSAPRAEPL